MSNKKKLPTYCELRDRGDGTDGRQNTKWSRKIVSKCKHKWQPVTIEDQFPDGSLDKKVYMICVKCCAWSYIMVGFVGYFLNSPDLLENPEK